MALEFSTLSLSLLEFPIYWRQQIRASTRGKTGIRYPSTACGAIGSDGGRPRKEVLIWREREERVERENEKKP